MEVEQEVSPLNVIEVIRNIQKSGRSPNQCEAKQCFPYLETFYTPNLKENHKFSNSNRFRSGFIYSDTLRFKDKAYSLNRLFKNCEIRSKNLTPVYKTNFSRPMTVRKENVYSMPRVMAKVAANESPKSFVLNKISSRIRKSISKGSRIKPILPSESNRMSPDMLIINKIPGEKLEIAKNSRTSKLATPSNKANHRKLVIELETVEMMNDSMISFPISRKITEVD